MAQSCVMKASMCAHVGWIMRSPWRWRPGGPPCLTDGQGDGDLLLHRRSVVMMAWAAASEPSGGQGGGGLGQSGLDGGDVDGLADDARCWPPQSRRAPASGGGGGDAHGLGVLMALGQQALALPAVGHHAPGHRRFPGGPWSHTGGGLHPVHGVGGVRRAHSFSDRIRARSFLSGLLPAFTPQWTPAAVNPLAAHTASGNLIQQE